MSNIFVENVDFQQNRNPGLAPLLSLLPGLGQIYNGQARKGLLFLATALSYLLVFLIILFNQSIVDWLFNFGQSVHMKPNSQLVAALFEFRLGSSLSFIVLGLYTAFVIYAMRDAHDQATFQQRRLIYADSALDMNEATSGSYLLHFASISLLFILAIFFFKHSPAPSQITNIEFVQSQLPTKKPIVCHYKSNQNSPSSGTHKPLPVLAASTAKGVKNMPKVLRESSNNNSLLPKFRPNVSQRSSTLPSPLQRTAVSPILPTPRNVDNHISTAPPTMPKVSSSQMDLPKPISADRSKSINSFVPPALNSTSNSKNLIAGVPGPISVISGEKFVPVPASGGPSSHSFNTGIPIGPTKASTMIGTPGIRGPVVRPFIPAVGEPGGTQSDNRLGNPSETVNNGPNSIPTLPVDFGAYMADLQRRIKHNWFPPKILDSKRIEVVFKIHRGGELTDLHILKSCGIASADEAAIRAVQNAAPFRSLPKGAAENIDIQFTFDYSVFSGSANLFRKF